MNKLLKRIVVLAIVATSVFSFGGCRTSYQFKEGNGKTLQFEEAEQLACIVDYKYSEQEESYWDYYSVEYEVESFGITFWQTGGSNFVELENIAILGDKGVMAHNEGIYYTKQNITTEDKNWKDEEGEGELFIDAIYNAYAVKVGWLDSLFLEEPLNDYCKDGWLAWVAGDSIWTEFNKTMKSDLKNMEYFYDRELLEFYNNNPKKFNCENSIYTLKELNEEDLQFFSRFFIVEEDGRTLYFDNEITDVEGKIDLSNSKRPVVEFSYTAYLPDLNQSITCSGKFTYSYVNNTVIEIPEGVKQLWKQDESYLRYAPKVNDFDDDFSGLPDWFIERFLINKNEEIN